MCGLLETLNRNGIEGLLRATSLMARACFKLLKEILSSREKKKSRSRM